MTQTIYDLAGRVVETRRLEDVGVDLVYVSGGSGTDHLGGIFINSFDPDGAVILSSTATAYDDQGRVKWT